MGKAKKQVIVSVINDLATDQRVSRTCHTLVELDYEVLLIGRKLPGSLDLPELPYQTKRMRLVFKRGALFYAFFNFRLFWKLLFSKADILWANDLDTLLANRMVSRLKGIPLIYDSHEYFTEVPELDHNKFAKKVWQRIERSIVPQLKYCITVNSSIAQLFKEAYNKDFLVIRNVPKSIPEMALKRRSELNIPQDKRIIILQGSGINVDRGAEELVASMSLVPDQFHLLIVGGGDVIDYLQQMRIDLRLENRITFVPKQPYAELIQYTKNSDVGVTLDKDTNINYKFSLPNKIFDYIQCGIPVIASNLRELKGIIDHYKIGLVVPSVTKEAIADSIKKLFSDPAAYDTFKTNTQKAAETLNWETEKHVLIDLMKKIE